MFKLYALLIDELAKLRSIINRVVIRKEQKS